MNKVYSVSKVLVVGLVTVGKNEEKIAKILKNKFEDIGVNTISFNSNRVEDAIDKIDESWDIIVGVGESIDKLRIRALEAGFHQVFWNVSINFKYVLFMGFNKSEFSGTIDPVLKKILEDIIKEVKLTRDG
ncbi:hypothetical protein ACQPU1_04805 [Clostridium paraputrificum]|uniref:hypothetical protein n=1 Tax=Clostridium TaxID=1485 RepID=UPI003D348BB6